MAHIQMFKACDNDEGHVAIICHRERHAADLKKMGFVESLEKLHFDEELKKLSKSTNKKPAQSTPK